MKNRDERARWALVALLCVALAGCDRFLGSPEVALFVGTTEVQSVHDVGDVVVGDSLDVTFTIANLGDAALHLTGNPLVALSGQETEVFALTSEPSVVEVSAGGETTFVVTFTPADLADYTAVLTLPTNDTDEPSYVVTLSGSGVAEAPAYGTVTVSISGLSGVNGKYVYAGLSDDTDGVWYTAEGIIQDGAAVLVVADEDGEELIPVGHSVGLGAFVDVNDDGPVLDIPGMPPKMPDYGDLVTSFFEGGSLMTFVVEGDRTVDLDAADMPAIDSRLLYLTIDNGGAVDMTGWTDVPVYVSVFDPGTDYPDPAAGGALMTLDVATVEAGGQTTLVFDLETDSLFFVASADMASTYRVYIVVDVDSSYDGVVPESQLTDGDYFTFIDLVPNELAPGEEDLFLLQSLGVDIPLYPQT